MPNFLTRKLFGSVRKVTIFSIILFVFGVYLYLFNRIMIYTSSRSHKTILSFNVIGYRPMHQRFSDTNRILDDVADAMRHSWKAYVDFAWGKDETLVLSKAGTRWMDACLTMIDSLDTLWMFNMKSEFNEARDWIDIHVNFDLDNDNISVFESTIRLLGGLLSAFHVSGDTMFLHKAELIAGKLNAAFVSKSGLPYTNINFRTLKASLPLGSGTVSLAEVGTLQLEFNELAMLLKNESIAKPAANVYKVLNKVNKLSGLLYYDLNFKEPESSPQSTITLGARGDSYYEYLVKVWVQTGRKSVWLSDAYLAAVAGIQDRLVRTSVPKGLVFVGELHGTRFSPKMDHLVCFLPATLAYGYLHGMPKSHLELAESMMETCFQLYSETATGLSPELVYFNLANSATRDFNIRRGDAFNLLRPETVESLFYLYRITKNPRYQKWGEPIFRAFNNHSRLDGAGFAPVRDVQSLSHSYRDKMESFWIAETLKYFRLLFDEHLADQFDLREWVFNTEAHPFPLPSPEAQRVVANLYNLKSSP